MKQTIGTLGLALGLLFAGAPITAQESDTTEERRPSEGPDYFPAVTQELSRLQLVPQCTAAAASCHFTHRLAPDADPVTVQVVYSRVTDTVYAYIDPLFTFGPDKTPDSAQLLRFLTLNGELVAAKLEWQPVTRSIRLSTVLSCDSNFDRRAFRSQLRGLLKVAETLTADPTLNPPAPAQARPVPAE